VAIECRWADDQCDRVSAMVAELVRVPGAVGVQTDAIARIVAAQTSVTHIAWR
jgi:hypothetical protein